MKHKDLLLRCYAAKESNGSWYATCLDLNLLAQEDSFTEAQNKLHTMIKDYLREAFSIDKEYVTSLIPRKAPFSFVLRYYFSSFINIFHQFKKGCFTNWRHNVNILSVDDSKFSKLDHFQ